MKGGLTMNYRTMESFKTIETMIVEVERLLKSHQLLEMIYHELGPLGNRQLSDKLREKIVHHFQIEE